MSRRGKTMRRPLISLNKQKITSFSSDDGEENYPFHLSTYSSLIRVYGINDFSKSINASTAHPDCHTVIELARSRLLQLNSSKDDVFCIIANRYVDKLKKSAEPFDDLELAMLLLASAEMVAEKDFACARKLLSLCDNSGLTHGTPIQRIIYYFGEALSEKINASLGAAPSKKLDWVKKIPMDVRQTQVSLEPAMIESHQESSSVVIEYTGIQCILDNIETSNKIHLIDFGINNGSHWIVLMQALAIGCDAPVELLKITAVGTSKKMLEETGKWLSAFAATLDLCFSYNLVLADLMDVKEDFFKLEDDETIAIYFPRRLSCLLAWPHHLERLMGIIKKINPCVMVVLEVETTINSPVFLERFNEAIVYFGAVFDCISVRFENYLSSRKLIEEVYLRQMIQNMIKEEGTNRIQRHENISFWRKFFSRFGLLETVLSPSAMSQANLLLKKTTFESLYSSHMDGECLILGWNGIPIQSISAWKFCK